MSRIRTIKPEFWTSEQVIACSLPARLLFIGLWNFCDDNGVHPASLMRLKAEIFPIDTLSVHDIGKLIGELVENKLVREYAVNGQCYWIVTGWKAHQRIDRPTYRYPLPASELRKIEESSSNIPRVHEDNSSNIRRVDVDGSITDRNGKEGNGKEKALCEVETSSLLGSHLNDAEEVFRYWQGVMGHPKAMLDKKRLRAIEGALGQGYSIDDLKRAIDGCARTPYNMGKNDQNQRYDDIGLIFRDAAHIERFIENYDHQPDGAIGVQGDEAMEGVII